MNQAARSSTASCLRALAPVLSVAALFFAGCSSGGPAPSTPPGTTPVSSPAPSPGVVSVSGTHLLRDGAVWVPRGLNVVAFNATPATRAGLFLTAYNNFNAAELAAMKSWGADTVRMFVAQAALDPNDPLFDKTGTFLSQFEAGVKAARAIGLNVIVLVQDESGTGEANPTLLPNSGTAAAWTALAPLFKGDNGVMFEIMNEPELPQSTANWALWATAMNQMVTIIRNAGATNVLIADGLSFAEQLDGAPILNDTLHQVAYAAHPYAHSAAEQTPQGPNGWDSKFGNVSVSTVAPVIVTEWSLENAPNLPGFQYCGSDSPAAALAMLNYLQGKGIGLIALGYDLPNQPMAPRDGRTTADEMGTPTTLLNTTVCTGATFGPGTIIQNWFRTGTVPAAIQ